jgi:CheY-like chemotaxis protein
MPTILYIDDTENNRILVTRRLERGGYQVLTAVSAEEGLALATARKPELILMDMGMPDVDGWTATRRLKADPALAGCDDYETKPFDFPRLLGKIESHLAARKTKQ